MSGNGHLMASTTATGGGDEQASAVQGNGDLKAPAMHALYIDV